MGTGVRSIVKFRTVSFALALAILAWAAFFGPGGKKRVPAIRATSATTLPRAPAKPIHVDNPANIYAAAGANMMSTAVADVPYRIYVPESADSYVDVTPLAALVPFAVLIAAFMPLT